MKASFEYNGKAYKIDHLGNVYHENAHAPISTIWNIGHVDPGMYIEVFNNGHLDRAKRATSGRYGY